MVALCLPPLLALATAAIADDHGSKAPLVPPIVNPYLGRLYERQYDDTERDTLIYDLNVRTGYPVVLLDRINRISELRKLLDTTRREHVVGADEACSLLSRDEVQRVYDFVRWGSPSRRALLIGTVSSAEFLDSFLVGERTELIEDGRSLLRVVARIRGMGGIEAAAARVAWLRPAVNLSREIDFDRLERELMFVRRATDEEASPAGHGTYIEEGQHRAIAAAWVLSQQRRTEQSITYLRGVNREGHVWGDAFWDVGPSRTEGATGALLCASAVFCCLRPFRRSRRAPRGLRAGIDRKVTQM